VLVPYAGFKTACVEFVRAPRLKGKTHYNYKSMFKLAGDSVVSSSVSPLRWALKWSLGIGFISCLGLVANLILFVLSNNLENFYFNMNYDLVTIILCMFLCLAIVLLALGIIGEYLARIMVESQNRPMYIIDEDIQ
jgi:dolichol-phosphate mannosyltransferase